MNVRLSALSRWVRALRLEHQGKTAPGLTLTPENLAVVLDLFARKPVGWAISFSPDSQLTIRALQMAWELRGNHKKVISHSDP